MTGDFSCREEQALVAIIKNEIGRLLSRNNNHLLSFMAIHLMQWVFPIASFLFTGSASKDVLNLIGSTGKNWTPIE